MQSANVMPSVSLYSQGKVIMQLQPTQCLRAISAPHPFKTTMLEE
jgi:hypothetical protein